MAVTSRRSIQIEFSGDVTAEIIKSAAENVTSPAISDMYKLTAGNNTIEPTNPTGFTRTGVTIIPPAGNTSLIRLKGDVGDIGFALHLTDPSSFGVNPPLLQLILDVVTDIEGVRIIWT